MPINREWRIRQEILNEVERLRVSDLRRRARARARDAGLDTNTADAVSRRVVERHTPHCNVDALIDEEIAKHAAP